MLIIIIFPFCQKAEEMELEKIAALLKNPKSRLMGYTPIEKDAWGGCSRSTGGAGGRRRIPSGGDKASEK